MGVETKVTHTPGPWTYEWDEDGGDRLVHLYYADMAIIDVVLRDFLRRVR